MSTLRVDAIRHNSATSDAITTASDGTCSAKLTSVGGGQLSNRNLIINGAMNVAQRGGVAGAHNSFAVDRFKFKKESTAANFDMTQSTTSPDGFSKSLKVDCTTADTSTANNEFVMVRYNIEAQDLQGLGYGTASAKPLVLSFYVRSSLTGVYGVNCLQIDNSNKIYSRTYTINSANTWEKKTISIPADTSGNINDDNGVGLQINFCLVIGSSYKGSAVSSAYESYANDKFASQHGVNFASSTSNEWYLTGVQLETGDTATTFEHRNFGHELTLCYRYYYRMNGDNNKTYMIGMSDNDNVNIYGHFHFPVPMRTAPTAIEQNGTAGHYKVRRDTTKSCTGVPTFVDAMPFYCRVNFPSSGHGWGTGQMLWCQGGNASSFLGFSAEL